MANALFTIYRNNMLGIDTYANVELDADTIKPMFVDHADDVPAPTTDNDISFILSAARVPAIASCPALASKTLGVVAAGAFDSADPTFTSLSGDQSESLIVFFDTGTESTSILLAFYDTFTSGMPITPNGGNVQVVVNASGWWQI